MDRAHAKKTHAPADAFFADAARTDTRIEIAHAPNSTVNDLSVYEDVHKFFVLEKGKALSMPAVQEVEQYMPLHRHFIEA